MAAALARLHSSLFLLLAIALCVDAARTNSAKSMTSMTMASRATARFEAEVQRMKREKKESEAQLKQSISIEKAYKILEKKNKVHSEAVSLIEQAMHAGNVSIQQHSLLQQGYNPSASLASARDMLGTMLTEASMEYDQHHLECSVFFKKQCSLMETCREDISTANSMAAEWRGKVLGAQKEINFCEIKIPHLEEELRVSIRECNKRLGFLRRDLAVVMNDVEVMKNVLNLTDCGSSSLLQMKGYSLCECKSDTASFTAVGHQELHRTLEGLKSEHVRQLVQEGLVQVAQGQTPQETIPTLEPITIFRNPPLPQQALPDDPCRNIDYDNGQGRGGCTLRGTPACFNLQNKFLTIQGETEDKRDDLLEEISDLTASCAHTKKTLEAEIEMYTNKLADEQTKLAESTSGENSAAEDGQMKSEEHTTLKGQMLETRTTCSQKFRTLESEMCALRKIRGELFKMKGDTHPFFQDCEVGDWQPLECSTTCGGGAQELERSVVVPASGGGAACPPLRQMQRCNEQPCPVDCDVGEWSGFSACSAQCGGGVRERSRRVKTQPRYDGEPCGDLEEAESCNMQACDKDCELAEWSEWSGCSKACNGGTKTRIKAVAEAAIGRGTCPSEESEQRMEHWPCNEFPCARDITLPVICRSKIDLVLLLDGSGSIGSNGWAATKAFAKKFVQGFAGPYADAQVSVILFSGPTTYSKLKKCSSGSSSGVDMASDCKITVVQHFSSDLATTQSNIDALTWPRGTTLTSVALEMAKAELTLGRSDATPVVLTVTDGIPMSGRRTRKAASRLKQVARLMFGAVKLSRRTLRKMMQWGSKPSSENVLKINDFQSLESIETIDALIEDICPQISLPTGELPYMTIR